MAYPKFQADSFSLSALERRVLNALIDLIALLNEEGYIVFANDAFWNALSLNTPHTRRLIHLREIVEEWNDVLAMAKSAPAQTVVSSALEVHLKTAEGSTVPVLFNITPTVLEGDRSGLILHAHDVREQRALSVRFQESQQKYQSIVESSMDGIVVIQDGRLVFANPAAARMFRYGSPDEMRMVSFSETVAPASRPFLFKDGRSGQLSEEILTNYEMKGLTREGGVIDLEINARLVTWNGRPAVLASLRDITDRKNLEREQASWLWEQETLTNIDRKLVSMIGLQPTLEAIAHNAKALTRADFAGVIRIEPTNAVYGWGTVVGNVSPVVADVLRIDEASASLLLKREPAILSALEQDGPTGRGYLAVLRAERIVAGAFFPLMVEAEIRGQLVVGYRRPHEFSARDLRLLISLAEKSSIAIANSELYDNLRKREKELELLSGARVTAQEEERRRIAREIHDSLGQVLTAIKFNVEILEDGIRGDEEKRKRIDEIKRLLDSAMGEAREISYNLMPSVLEDFGLVPALQLLCEQFSSRNSPKVNFLSQGVIDRLERSLEVNLYRIAQEALNNIAKHAKAREATVQVVRHSEGIRLTIEDDGVGMDLKTIEPDMDRIRGMGLVSMRERANTFGGTFLIDSSPGFGTTVVVDIPLRADSGGSR